MSWIGYALIELAEWLDSDWLTPPLYRLGNWLEVHW